MLTMRIDHMVEQIVRHLLSAQSEKDKALYLHFDLRLSHYIDGESYGQSRGLHLLYHQTYPGSAYISVFSAVTDSPFAKLTEVGEWKHECSHDSCWRDVQVFSQTYFDMAKRINAMLKEDGHPEVAPKDMHESNTFGVFSKELYSWVPVEVTKDPEDGNSYRRLIKVLK